MPNFVQVGQAVPEIWPFIEFFNMAAVCHLGFLKVGNFNCPYCSEGQNASPCQILCKSVKALRRYGRFRFFKMAAVRHLGFQKLEILTARIPWRAKMRHHARFCADRSNRCGDMAVYNFQDGGRPPSWICYTRLDHPRSVLWWSLSLCKIWFESVQ